MRYLTLAEVLELHRLLIDQSGGAEGLRDLGGLESALAQPRMTFDEKELGNYRGSINSRLRKIFIVANSASLQSRCAVALLLWDTWAPD